MKSKVAKKINTAMAVVASYIMVVWAESYWVMCDIFDDIQKVSKNTQSKLVSTITVLLPLIAIIDLGFIVFTRDQKKLAVEWAILGGSLLGFVIMLVINNGDLAGTLQNLVK